MSQKLIDFLRQATIEEAKMMATVQSLKDRTKKLQFIRLIKEYSFDDLSPGRYTVLEKGINGFVLDEETIACLPGASWRKKHQMIQELMDSNNQNKTYALVGGYPCSLEQSFFELLQKTPIRCIGELI